MAEAFIKLHRKMLDWEWYKDTNTFCLFLHCLLIANWKDGRFMGQVIPRGSFVSSYPQLAQQTNMSVQNVRTAINHLKSTGELTVKSHAKFSVFTVVNYCQYQDDNRQLTDSQQATNRQLTTIEEGKNIRTKENTITKTSVNTIKKTKENITSNNNIYFPNDEILNQAFIDYMSMRKKIKKPMTDRAVDLAIKKLMELSGGDNDKAVKILNQSIMNSWQGLFELKDESLASKWGVDSIDWSKV